MTRECKTYKPTNIRYHRNCLNYILEFILLFLLGLILKYYTLQTNGIAIFQAFEASKLVLLSPNRVDWCNPSIFVEIVQLFPQPMRLHHFTDLLFKTEMWFWSRPFSFPQRFNLLKYYRINRV